MIIYTNGQFEILSLDSPPDQYEHTIEVDSTRQEMFGGLCDACIRGYRYAPAYEYLFDEDGNHLRDNMGNPRYKTDSDGNPIQMGWQCYPYVDAYILRLMQDQHDEAEAEAIKLQLAMVEQYEANLALQEAVTATQLALVDIYEGGEVWHGKLYHMGVCGLNP